MPLRMKIALIIATATLVMIAYLWIRSDLEAWGEMVLVMDELEEPHVVVRPGDSLWAIATREWPDRDPRKGVYELLQANPWIGRDCRILPGQKVRLP